MLKEIIKTTRRTLSIPFAVIAGAFATLTELIGGYYVEFDISEINSD